ncbi:acyl-CoA thioesterase [Georgenia sp. 311]|uniref:Acyl-CoA thioesterase n=1 Tax=Georgenia wutianyii TaxID=2585135 RepID=A0ABX5VLM3_9MICO|nr:MULTISPECIES: thioesterase family protein [Georgenia]QDB78611.1 acyl-CoA thioesterase [Georgenia wutianyii]TNC17653.1 acyl-CoA thioesterase [Georgenia sp. 311]
MTRLTVPVRLRWSDIDGYGHVNNAAVLTLLEEARIAVFWAGADDDAGAGGRILASGPGADTATFIAHQEIEYAAPLEYSTTPLQVELWLARMGGASLDVCYEVPGAQGVAVRAMTTLVLVDPATGRPRRITAEERAAWAHLVEEPVRFRRSLSR